MPSVRPGPSPPGYVLTDMLRERAESQPDAVAFRVGAGDDVVDEVTFGDWAERAEESARGLASLGVLRGDRVALLFGQREWTAYTVAYTAVLRLGAVAVHLPSDDPETTAERILAVGATGVIRGVDVSRVRLPSQTWEVAADALPTPGRALPRVPLEPDDPADILWTSGTTGPAKAFVNAQGTLMYGRGPSGLARLDISRAIVAPMPMGTASSAMSAAFMPLVARDPVLLCDPGDIEAIGMLASRHGASTLMITPWTAMRIVESGLADRVDLSGVSTIALASAALPARTARRFQELIPGVSIRTFYAQGEAVPAVVLGVFDAQAPLRLGMPGPESQVRIVGPEGQDVPVGELGEIAMCHPAPRRRHFDPACDAAARRDGWTLTGDLGHVEADGSVHLFDRTVDVVRTSAGPVSSQQVEQVLYDHDCVREVAVVGVPERDGQPSVPEAFVVLACGAADAALTVEDLCRFADARLDAREVPVRWHVVDALPRGRTGKVLKFRLRQATGGHRPDNGAARAVLGEQTRPNRPTERILS